MNTLSWLLYAADVSENLHFLATMIVVLASFAFGMALITGGAASSDGGFNPHDEAKNSKGWAVWRKVVWWTASVTFVTFLISGFLPQKQTIYLIAGSQIGETVINTPEARETLSLVQNKLREVLGPATPAQERTK